VPLTQGFVSALPAFYAHECILYAVLGVHGWRELERHCLTVSSLEITGDDRID